MNILLINSVYKYGSTGRITAELHEALKSHGDISSVIYGRKQALGKEEPEEELTDPDIYYICNGFEQTMDIAFSVLTDSHGLHSKINTSRIIHKIMEIQPDLIHLHNIHGFYLNYPMLFSFLKQYGKPVVWTLHDCWAYTGYCAYYSYHECMKWKTGCHGCRYRDEYPYRIFSRSASNYSRKEQAWAGMHNLTLVTPSRWLKNEIQLSMLHNLPVQVIYNDVNLKEYYYQENTLRKEYELEGKKVYLACASVWTMQKGWNEYLKLAGLLSENERLVIIGVSETQKISLPSNVIAISRQDASELRKWYSMADCCINLTLEDNYPTVNIEAAACGCPVVTYDTGGSKESAGEYAGVVKKYDAGGALETARTMKRLNNHACQPAGMVKEYIALYQKILSA